jgi:hypothetical protein
MLAVTVLENIEHQCKIEGCEAEIIFGYLEAHMKTCIHRIIVCPATECDVQMAFCNIIDHLLNECWHSFTRGNKGLTDLLNKPGPYKRPFYVTEEKGALKVYTYMYLEWTLLLFKHRKRC